MSRPWWDQAGADASVVNGSPVLLPGGRSALLRALQSRIVGFVPEWRGRDDADAGVALTRLFGVQLEPVIQRVGRLPDKSLVEFLRVAGISLSPPRPSRGFIRFEPAPRNDAPVMAPQGFRLSSARSDGGDGEVIWEIEEALPVPNLTLSEILAFDGEFLVNPQPGEAFRPFGERPAIRAALYLGFDLVGSAGSAISLLFERAATTDPDAASRGGAPPAVAPPPWLRWEALTSRGFTAADVSRDETEWLNRTGLALVRLPSDWPAARPSIDPQGPPRHWLRLRLASGTIRRPPRLANVYAHVVAATAQETQREEFPVREAEGRLATVRLTRAPVLPGSVVLEVDEGAASADLFELPADGSTASGFRPWVEVASLAGQRGDARVFSLDPATGTIRFGDGREGKSPPSGVRNIAVRSYATTVGEAGNVGPDEINVMVSPLPGIQAVSNPLPTSGGADAEAVESAKARGPAKVKARGRAVTTSDAALLAVEAAGADIVRAFVLSGVDPAYPGATVPGTIGVFVIARRHPKDQSVGPPRASSQALGAVADFIADQTGPLGARIVVANPRFHEIVIEATVNVAPGRDPAVAMAAVNDALDRYLNPESGGGRNGEWSVGATLRHSSIVRVVLDADDRIVSVPFLEISVDGISRPACSDAVLSRFGLPWPGRHRLLVEIEGAAA